jgi:hypothetical protein
MYAIAGREFRTALIHATHAVVISDAVISDSALSVIGSVIGSIIGSAVGRLAIVQVEDVALGVVMLTIGVIPFAVPIVISSSSCGSSQSGGVRLT